MFLKRLVGIIRGNVVLKHPKIINNLSEHNNILKCVIYLSHQTFQVQLKKIEVERLHLVEVLWINLSQLLLFIQ
jgi:hypothetical protein